MKLITLLLVAYFLKQLVWLSIIPMWHFPDEEQHFGQVAFLAEKNRLPRGSDLDINKEIDVSSEILGTKRSKLGINKFTYHPEYRIPYSKNDIGLYEDKIINLNTDENRQTMVKAEAARYGPVYYYLATFFYKVFYQHNLLVRVFSSRFISVLLSTFTVYFVYLIAKLIFKKQVFRLTLTFLVAFQPMFSFISSGINSDNIFNLIFTLILYFCLKIFFNRPSEVQSSNINRLFKWFFLVLVLMAGYYTKKQIYIACPIILLAMVMSFMVKTIKINKKNIFIASLVILIISLLFIFKIRIPEFNSHQAPQASETFWQYIYWHLKHTIAETIPWYWGVFNWLGVTLPRWVNRVQSRILVISAVGFIMFFIKQIKRKKFNSLNNFKIFFLLVAAAIYYVSIISWDYLFRTTHSFSFGIQGRYFFPTIVSHMLFILLGILALIPAKFKYFKIIIAKILVLWWLVFSFIGLKTALNSYYQLWPFKVFLNQVSQYKPILFKSPGIGIIIIFYIFSLLIFTFKFLKLNEAKTKAVN